jgi:hypothetical protein
MIAIAPIEGASPAANHAARLRAPRRLAPLFLRPRDEGCEHRCQWREVGTDQDSDSGQHSG